MNSHPHKHRKRFGQHFLADDFILREMQRCINPCADDHMVEVGPGLGVLTKYLLPHVARYDAIEIDRDLVSILKESFGHHDNFVIHSQDVLHTDWRELAKDGKKLRVVGNLPYNISTPLLFSLYSAIDLIEDMHFLLQREVGLRMAAEVGSTNYGRLSVMTQFFCVAELLFDVDPDAFDPPPKVDSIFLRLLPRTDDAIAVTNIHTLESIVASAFNQRRKTLRNSLRKLLDETAFVRLDIDPQKRAQDLTVEEFVRIANFV